MARVLTVLYSFLRKHTLAAQYWTVQQYPHRGCENLIDCELLSWYLRVSALYFPMSWENVLFEHTRH